MVFSLGFTSFEATTASAAEPATGYPVSGKVTAKGSDNFTLLFTSTNTSVTFKVNSSTQFMQDGKAVTFGELKVGMLVNALVISQGQGRPYLALKVTLPAASPTTCEHPYTSGLLEATVAAKTADSFSVKWSNGQVSTVPFRVTGATQFIQDGHSVSFADLKVGQHIQFQLSSCGDGKYYAVKVILPTANPPACANPYTSGMLSATVAGKSEHSFTVTWSNGETSKTPFMVNSATQFFHGGQPASFNDLHTGQHIQFQLKTCGDGAYTVVKVYF
jgi:hypothetical protein